jgi:hypothetical protein
VRLSSREWWLHIRRIKLSEYISAYYEISVNVRERERERERVGAA